MRWDSGISGTAHITAFTSCRASGAEDTRNRTARTVSLLLLGRIIPRVRVRYAPRAGSVQLENCLLALGVTEHRLALLDRKITAGTICLGLLGVELVARGKVEGARQNRHTLGGRMGMHANSCLGRKLETHHERPGRTGVSVDDCRFRARADRRGILPMDIGSRHRGIFSAPRRRCNKAPQSQGDTDCGKLDGFHETLLDQFARSTQWACAGPGFPMLKRFIASQA